MKLLRLIVPTLAGLLMVFGVVAAFAGSQPSPASPPPPRASETNLLPSGFAQNIHADAAGKLWITEIDSGTVRHYDPATRAFTLYTGLTNTLDAQLGPDGKLWWIAQSTPALARMDLGSRLVTTWPLSTTFAQALTFDGNHRAWIADFISIGLYRLDPGGKEFCDVDLPDNGASQTIAEHNGALWVGDVHNGRIGRITPATNDFTYWSLAFAGGNPDPTSITFAPNGDVWWADAGLGKIGRLEPGANRLTLFGPPGLLEPQQVAYQGGKVWFTDPFTASLGFVDPAVATGSPPVVVIPVSTTLAPDCVPTAPGPSFTAGVSASVASFSPLVFTTTVDNEGTLYASPAGGEPWGLTATSFDVWATDVGRDKLMRIDTALHLYLPALMK